MKYLAIIPVLFLTACANKQPTYYKERLVVVKPQESMYNCPTIKAFPNPDKLTDIQVAKLIVTLYKNNETCKISIEGIRQFLNEAEKVSLEKP